MFPLEHRYLFVFTHRDSNSGEMPIFISRMFTSSGQKLLPPSAFLLKKNAPLLMVLQQREEEFAFTCLVRSSMHNAPPPRTYLEINVKTKLYFTSTVSKICNSSKYFKLFQAS